MFLASDGVSRGVLVMWDSRMMVKLEDFVGSSLWLVLLEVSKIIFFRLLQEYMGPIWTVTSLLWDE